MLIFVFKGELHWKMIFKGLKEGAKTNISSFLLFKFGFLFKRNKPPNLKI
jgi:hypothetical protein